MTIRFSVAVPAYNCAAYIGATLDGILAQRYPPDEVIVVDDGSTDATPQILQHYRDRVSVFRVKNGGPGAARKLAVESCQNNWIAMCDSDDIWDTNHLERFVKMIALCPFANILSTNFLSFGPTANRDQDHFKSAGSTWLIRHGNTLTKECIELRDPYRAFLEFNPIYPSGLAITRKIYDSSGGIKRKYSRWTGEDSEFARRLIANPAANVLLDLEISWHYRRHGANFSETQWKNIHAKARILKEHLIHKVVPANLVHDTERWATKTQGQAFDIAFWTGHYAAAVELYRELPAPERSPKRILRHCLSWVRARS